VSSSEVKLWIVPRIDSRQIDSHRHAKDLAFPDSTDKELPPFVAHAKLLWDKCYHNETQQQPTRPTTFTGTSGVRFLSHSSIKSGWDHLKAVFHQLGRVSKLQSIPLVLPFLDSTDSSFLTSSTKAKSTFSSLHSTGKHCDQTRSKPSSPNNTAMVTSYKLLPTGSVPILFPHPAQALIAKSADARTIPLDRR
jgi:hypothetical protein